MQVLMYMKYDYNDGNYLTFDYLGNIKKKIEYVLFNASSQQKSVFANHSFLFF